MEKLRKVLVVVFSVLCVFFAYEAYLQKRDKSVVDSIARFALNVYRHNAIVKTDDWGPGLRTLGSQTGRLVFVEVEPYGGASAYVPSAGAERVLASNYVTVTLKKDYFPGDYGILRRIANGDVNVAILSTKAYPLLVGGGFSADAGSPESDEKVLRAVAVTYKKRNTEASSGVRIALLKAGADKRMSAVPGFFAERKGGAEILNIRSFFAADSWGVSIAAFTENARLVARLAAGGNPAARETATLASEKLTGRLSGAENTFAEKLLLARALSDFVMLDDSQSLRDVFITAAESVLSSQRPDGFFADSETVLLRDNALASSLMARAFKISGDTRYLESMRKSLSALQSRIGLRASFPAVIADASSDNPPSEASALDYVLVARAYLDAYFAASDNAHLELSQKTFKRLDELFMDSSTGLWYENSKASVFAPFHYKMLNDSAFPSTTGEALQILADVSSSDVKMQERLMKILSALHVTAAPETFLDRASIKLSVLASPMRTAPAYPSTAMSGKL